MTGSHERPSGALRKADLARVLSPLLFFFAHVLYLAFWSPDPFLKRWIDGSFSFFLALVLCNIIRARVVAASAPPDDGPDGSPSPPQDEPSADGAARSGPP